MNKEEQRVFSIQEGHATLNLDRTCPKCGNEGTILCDGGWETCGSEGCDYKDRGARMNEEQQFKLMADCPEIQDGWEPKVGDWTDKGMVSFIFESGNTKRFYIELIGSSESFYNKFFTKRLYLFSFNIIKSITKRIFS